MNLKLSESWEGPFTVTKKNSPLSYGIDTRDRKIPLVHVQLMKRYDREQEHVKVRRVMSVLESDTDHDDILSRYSETEIVERQLKDSQKSDIDNLLSKYQDVMTSEPGITKLTEFAIEARDAEPIFQRPYNTPAAFKASIAKKIDCLLGKGSLDHLRVLGHHPWYQ